MGDAKYTKVSLRRFARGRTVASVRRLAALLTVGLVGSVAPVASAAPPNDDFKNALALHGLPTEAIASNVGATREVGEPNHRGYGGSQSIWFKWTAPTNGAVTLTDVRCGPPFEDSFSGIHVMAVYVGSSVDGLVEIAGSYEPFRVTAHETYWIAVDTPPGTPPDPDLCVRLLPGPSNDDFAAATPLVGFPVSVTQTIANVGTLSRNGGATREANEPHHGGNSAGGTVWYSWTAPEDDPVHIRVCGLIGALAVYTGDRIDALTNVGARRTRTRGCGSQPGASVAVSAVSGQTYRIAIASTGVPESPPSFQLVVGNEAAVVTVGRTPFFSYVASPGQVDGLDLRLVGTGRARVFLLRASGVASVPGCFATAIPGELRCPVPGRAAPVLAVDLGDQADTADIRVAPPVTPSFGTALTGQVLAGDGNDTLTGSVGGRGRLVTPMELGLAAAPGRLGLFGGSGADLLRGGDGADRLDGGAGPDEIDPGRGRDHVDGGLGDDRIRTADGSIDSIRCRGGRDRATVDGTDLPRDCEARTLTGPARAVATGAVVSNAYGDGADRLLVFLACPIDARAGCRASIKLAVSRRRTISRGVRLARGRAGVLRFFRVDFDRLVHRGLAIRVSTRRRSGGTLEFKERLPVPDARYATSE